MTSEREPAPDWAYEPVHVVAPDPWWPVLAEHLVDEVERLVGDLLASHVVHVGSTAVPDLPAKPIIDLQAVAKDPAGVVADREAVLAGALWHLVPRELDRRPWRWFFVRSDVTESCRLAHLHLMTVDEPRWHDQLTFRDKLRASPELVREYARLKEEAAVEHTDDREAYTRAKVDFVRRVVGR